MNKLDIDPSQCIIVEDSPKGIEAQASVVPNSNIWQVKNSTEVTHENYRRFVDENFDSNAGEGSRFAKEGYTFPKPLIDVNGKPMIQTVVENLDYDAEYIFLVRKKHLDTYVGLVSTLERITNGKSRSWRSMV